jgi:7,8-dihydropterin-6-yl-methyl-4-(beta-D-ribofuranosyl)aminobenzene 5'-phosphate synthase
MLLDFGLTSHSLFTNLRLLGIQPDQADALVLSHGHGDHYGGLLALAESTPAWAERDVPFYVGGEDTFCRRWTVDSEGMPVHRRRDLHGHAGRELSTEPQHYHYEELRKNGP